MGSFRGMKMISVIVNLILDSGGLKPGISGRDNIWRWRGKKIVDSYNLVVRSLPRVQEILCFIDLLYRKWRSYITGAERSKQSHRR